MKTQIQALAPFAPITVNIRGKVQYSHITKKIEGAELDKVNERKIRNGGIAETTPYYALNLSDASILDADQLPPVVKAFFEEKLSTKNTNNVMTTIYYGKDKSQGNIQLAYGSEAGVDLAGKPITNSNVPLPHELAVGLDVTLGAKVYTLKKGVAAGRVGIGIDYVIVNEPIRYYSGKSGLESALAAQGVTYQKNAEPVTEGAIVTGETENQSEEDIQPAKVDTVPQSVSPMVAPAPTVQPAAAPVQPNVVPPVYQAPIQAQAQMAQAQTNPMVAPPVYPQGGANPQVAPVQEQPQVAPTPGLSYTPNN